MAIAEKLLAWRAIQWIILDLTGVDLGVPPSDGPLLPPLLVVLPDLLLVDLELL